MEDKVKRGSRKRRRGTVVSARQNKTLIVETFMRKPHPLFKKTITKRKKFVVHDENGQGKEGDVVLIEETRPLSKTKRWRLVKVLSRSEGSAEKFDEVHE